MYDETGVNQTHTRHLLVSTIKLTVKKRLKKNWATQPLNMVSFYLRAPYRPDHSPCNENFIFDQNYPATLVKS